MIRRIALLGLSGVGKSTLIANLNNSIPVFHLQASSLIKAEQAFRAERQASSEELRLGPVIDNQKLLIDAFHREAAAATAPIVFDAHSIIDGNDGILEIPSDVFASLGLDAICFLTADPKVIAERRHRDLSRMRPQRDAETLAQHQAIARRAAERIANDIRRPFVLIQDGGVEEILRLLM